MRLMRLSRGRLLMEGATQCQGPTKMSVAPGSDASAVIPDVHQKWSVDQQRQKVNLIIIIIIIMKRASCCSFVFGHQKINNVQSHTHTLAHSLPRLHLKIKNEFSRPLRFVFPALFSPFDNYFFLFLFLYTLLCACVLCVCVCVCILAQSVDSICTRFLQLPFGFLHTQRDASGQQMSLPSDYAATHVATDTRRR